VPDRIAEGVRGKNKNPYPMLPHQVGVRVVFGQALVECSNQQRNNHDCADHCAYDPEHINQEAPLSLNDSRGKDR
jgi:hypothetical protein